MGNRTGQRSVVPCGPRMDSTLLRGVRVVSADPIADHAGPPKGSSSSESPGPAGHLAAFGDGKDAVAKRGRSRRAGDQRGRRPRPGRDAKQNQPDEGRVTPLGRQAQRQTRPISHIKAIQYPVVPDQIVRGRRGRAQRDRQPRHPSPPRSATAPITVAIVRHRLSWRLLAWRCDSAAGAGASAEAVVPRPGRVRFEAGENARQGISGTSGSQQATVPAVCSMPPSPGRSACPVPGCRCPSRSDRLTPPDPGAAGCRPERARDQGPRC